ASAASLRIRNIQLARESAERRRLEDEISLARRIQLNLLPTRLPEVEGYAFLGRNLPSRHVSGDFYQVLTRSEGREVVLMVADVSGKGIAAALLTASLEALLAAPIEAGREPAQIFARVGGLLHRRTPPEKFATAFLAVLDVGSGRLAYSGAGHPPALLVRESGGTEWLDGRGFPLGILPDAEYDQGETILRQGDTLLLYTDGITEAMNPDHDLYESDRLEAVVRDHRLLDLHALAAVLEKDLETFAQGEPFADDRTAVLLRRL
ncbi:MAG: PP2C family protein-serine/threonine phosphatase, partial [Acidobacteriota bacterium]